VTVTVSDGNDGTDVSFKWFINTPPTIDSLPDLLTAENESVSIEVSADDDDNDTLEYDATGLPSGVSIDENDGEISGTPNNPGSYSVRVIVTDGIDEASTRFDWDVNESPDLDNPGRQQNNVGDEISLTIEVDDSDSNDFEFEAQNLPNGLSINEDSGRISGTLTQGGRFNVTIKVSDGLDTDSISFRWDVNTPPDVNGPNDRVDTLGSLVSLDIVATDEEDDDLSYEATNLPPDLDIDTDTGEISGTLTEAGSYTVLIEVSDDDSTVSVSFKWTVNTPPTLSDPGNQTGVVGNAVSLNVAGADSDGDDLSYLAEGLPPGLSIDGDDGEISGTPTAAGSYSVEITVSDGIDEDSVSFSWTVLQPTATPTGTLPPTMTPTTTPTPAPTMTPTMTPTPTPLPDHCAGLVQEAEDGLIVGDMVIGELETASGGKFVHVPDVDEDFYTEASSKGHRVDFCVIVETPGSFRIMADVLALEGTDNSFYITVDKTDQDNSVPEERWDLPVTEPEEGVTPEFTSAFITRFDIEAGDPLPNPLTIQLSEGAHVISFRAREDGAMIDKMELVPLDNNSPIVFTPGNLYHVAGEAINIDVFAQDADGDAISYEAAGLPPGVQLHPQAGQLTGTPTRAGEFNVAITASDGRGGSNTIYFVWVIAEDEASLPQFIKDAYLPLVNQ
ncbi:MAG: putative Ig domain-containing protein, partial [Chloroflexota bacterium]